MKVLQIIDKLDVGGAERVFVDLTNLLNESSKINLSILTFDSSGKLSTFLNKKILKVNYTRSNKLNLITAYKLSKILKKYDILHVHMRHVYRYIKVVTLLFNVKTKIVFHDHYGNISVDKKIPLFFNTFLKPDYYIGVSNELTDWAKQKLKVKNIFSLSNIIISNKLFTTEVHKKGFVIVGNIKPIKNQLFAIQLAKELNKELTIIGQIQDYNYYHMLLVEINKLDYQNSIYFLHNINDVKKIINNFELGLMTSVSESGPLVLIEYLSQNLNFIAHKTGNVSKKLSNRLPNFFIENFNLSEWKIKIDLLKNDDKNLNEIYQKEYSPKKYLEKCLKIYKEIEGF